MIIIAHNPVMNHIKIDKHFIMKKLASELIYNSCVSTHWQLVHIVTKGLSSLAFQSIVSKLGMMNTPIHQPEKCGKTCIP